METTNAESLVLGAALLNPDALRFATGIIDHQDFADPRKGDLFRTMLRLQSEGQPIEPFTVYTRAVQDGLKGVDMADLHHMVENVGASASISHYATQVQDAATRHRLTAAAQRLMREATDPEIPPSEALQTAKEALADVRENRRMSTRTLEEILAETADHDWLVPGLFERGDRLVLTGFEGAGKTTWIRQLLITMAAGLHPITFNHLHQPLTTLVVDVENTEAQWRHQTRKMAETAAKAGTRDPRPHVHIHAKGRLDITKDATLGEIHRLVDLHKPDVLAIGPLYKLVPRGITNDDDAAPVITALDSLRDRGLVLLLEAHAKKQDNSGGERDLAPRGSAALLGWPEFGFGLYPQRDELGKTISSRIVRWRGDRDSGRAWPNELYTGGPFPWTADNVAPEVRRQLYPQPI